MHNLSNPQKEIMKLFYSIVATKVVFDKTQRTKIWKPATSKSSGVDFSLLHQKCPAIVHQISKSYQNGKNIQSAVFSECSYAQTIANMRSLNIFLNCLEDPNCVPGKAVPVLDANNLVPRYIYTNDDRSEMLIQAGGCGGIDCAYIIENDSYTIEFKEPGAKTSEPDLPKYREDGNLLVTDDFLRRYPQFKDMLDEQSELNFFDVMGNNVHDFSPESINVAVSENYTEKYADVICTEDINGYLVMIPTNQVEQWSVTEGEIRPAGRNHYNVWTPNALNNFLREKGAIISGRNITIKKSVLGTRTERGGNRRISGYKINPLFFVYLKDCLDHGSSITFMLDKVQQLNPTIAGKMFFKTVTHSQLKKYYSVDF